MVVSRRAGGLALGLSAVLLAAGCSSSGSEQSPASPSATTSPPAAVAASPAEAGPADEESPAAEEQTPVGPPVIDSPEAAEAALAPLELWLDYIPTYELTSSQTNSSGSMTPKALSNVIPSKCQPLHDLFTGGPGPDPEGMATFWAASSVSLGRGDVNGDEDIYAFGDATQAKATFDEFVALAPACERMNELGITLGPVVSITEGASPFPSLTFVTDYYGLGVGLGEITLIEDRIVVTASSFGGRVKKSNARKIFDRWTSDAVAYASGTPAPSTTGDSSDDPAQLTLACLPATVDLVRVRDDYSETYGYGKGDDAFLEVKVKVTNECGKPIKAYAWDVEVTDAFGERLFLGTDESRQRIKPGAQASSPEKGRGFIIRKGFDDGYEVFLDTPLDELTAEVSIAKIEFADGTSLP